MPEDAGCFACRLNGWAVHFLIFYFSKNIQSSGTDRHTDVLRLQDLYSNPFPKNKPSCSTFPNPEAPNIFGLWPFKTKLCLPVAAWPCHRCIACLQLQAVQAKSHMSFIDCFDFAWQNSWQQTPVDIEQKSKDWSQLVSLQQGFNITRVYVVPVELLGCHRLFHLKRLYKYEEGKPSRILL